MSRDASSPRNLRLVQSSLTRAVLESAVRSETASEIRSGRPPRASSDAGTARLGVSVWARSMKNAAAILRQMLSNEQIKEFHENGFTVVPNAISKERVAELRSYLVKDFDAGERFKSD